MSITKKEILMSMKQYFTEAEQTNEIKLYLDYIEKELIAKDKPQGKLTQKQLDNIALAKELCLHLERNMVYTTKELNTFFPDLSIQKVSVLARKAVDLELLKKIGDKPAAYILIEVKETEEVSE